MIVIIQHFRYNISIGLKVQRSVFISKTPFPVPVNCERRVADI